SVANIFDATVPAGGFPRIQIHVSPNFCHQAAWQIIFASSNSPAVWCGETKPSNSWGPYPRTAMLLRARRAACPPKLERRRVRPWLKPFGAVRSYYEVQIFFAAFLLIENFSHRFSAEFNEF